MKEPHIHKLLTYEEAERLVSTTGDKVIHLSKCSILTLSISMYQSTYPPKNGSSQHRGQ